MPSLPKTVLKHILAAVFCVTIAGQILALQTGKRYNFRFKDGQLLRNAVLLEETENTYRVRLEYISDEKILEKKDLKELPVLAHSLSLSPATGTPLAKLGAITIGFAEPTLGAENRENYELSGSALGTLKISAIKQTGKFQYEVQFTGQHTDGDLVVHLRNITDNVGAALMTDSIEYKLDATKPGLETTPANKSAVRSLDELLLQFSEEVTGANNPQNYAISAAKPGSLKLAQVMPHESRPHQYRLVFKGKPGNGEVRLRLKNIADRAGNPLDALEIAFIVDTIRPNVTISPAPNLLLRGLTNIELNFSETVVGADVRENYAITGTGAGNLRVHGIARTERGQYRLKVSGSPDSGTVSVRIANVTDAAGNTLEQDTFTYRTDVQAPEFTATPVSGSAVSGLSAVDVNFSKPVTGANDLRNFQLEGSGVGSLVLKKINKTGNARYTLNFTGNPSNGNIILRLNNITDAAGNALRNAALEYRADTTPPRYTASPLPGSAVNLVKEIDLQFSEPVIGADKAGNYGISGTGTEKLSLVSVSNLQENTYRLKFDGALQNGKFILHPRNISDAAGNPLATGMLEYLADITPPEVQKISPRADTPLRELTEIELQFSEPVTGAENTQNYSLSGEGAMALGIASATALPGNKVRLAMRGQPGEGKLTLHWQNITDRAGNLPKKQFANFFLDTQGPVFQADLPRGIAIASLQNISVLYSEPVTGAENPLHYRVSGSGVGSLAVKNVTKTKSGAYVMHFTGTPRDGEVTLQILHVTDIAGNALQENSLAFTTDVTPPRFTFSPTEEKPLNKLDEIQLSFSEAVFGADQAENYSLTGEGIGDLKILRAEAILENKFKIYLSGKPGNGRIALQLGDVTDAAGNKAQKDTLVFRADTTAPTFVVTPKSGALAKEFSHIDVSYSKPVTGGSEPQNYMLSGDGVGSLKIDRITGLGASKYRVLLSGKPQSGAIQFTIANVNDLAGNILVQNPVVYRADTAKPGVTASLQPETTLNQLSEIALHFSKQVTGAENTANYRLSGNGIGSLHLEKVVKREDDNYVLVFSGAAAQGEIVLAWDRISDLAGNTPETVSLRYHIDQQPVEMHANPASRSKVVALKEIELKFSKETTGAKDINNYEITGEYADSLKLATVENRGKNTYLLRFSGEGSGAIQILIKNVKDPAGNGLKTNRLNYVIEIPTASQPSGDIVR